MILSQHTEIGIQSIMHSQMSDMERVIVFSSEVLADLSPYFFTGSRNAVCS